MLIEFTRPASSNRIRSQSIIVFNLCAMMSMVQDWNSCRIVFWIRASVLTSTAAVASSRTRTFDLRSNALARLMSCLCPTLKLSPPSETLIKCRRDYIVNFFFSIENSKTLQEKPIYTKHIIYFQLLFRKLDCLNKIHFIKL